MKSGSKVKTAFVCENCGSSFASWYGKCPDCAEWNSLKEFRSQNIELRINENLNLKTAKTEFVALGQSAQKESVRLLSGFSELDRVLGGGLVKDEVILLSGEPGIGKSTLILSILDKISNNKIQISPTGRGQANQTQSSKFKTDKNAVAIYISTEEEVEQINARCLRLGVNTKNIMFTTQKNIDTLIIALEELISQELVNLLVFDSLQGFYSTNSASLPGSVAQSKEVLLRIVQLSKTKQITSLVIGHVTKEGEIAGPKFLEHMVDCVLFMEGEALHNLRMLRAFKNRFGPTDEIGFFEMTGQGMREVTNPSEYFLEWDEQVVGKASIGIREGQRIVFATVETLVVTSMLTFPKRVAKGIDSKRLELILAILKKYLGLNVDKYDIYVSVSGGLRVNDPLADLGMATAVYSSLVNQAFSPKYLFLGEVGLLGNVRKSSFTGPIIKEAKRLGFTKVYSAKNLSRITQLKLIK